MYLQRTMYDEALRVLLRERELSNIWDPYIEGWIGVAHALMNNAEEARQILDEFLERSKQTYVPPYCLAIIYFALGEKDQGFIWLERGYEKRDKRLTFLRLDPIFVSIGSDPRYIALMNKMGLEK